MNKQIYSKNHYVPQFYLKNWSENNELYVYNKLVSHKNVPLFRKKKYKSIAYTKNIYAMQKEETEFNELENWFNFKIETPYKETQNKILNNEKLYFNDYTIISKFAFSQYLRVPKYYLYYHPNIAKNFEENFERGNRKLFRKLRKNMRKGSNIAHELSKSPMDKYDIPFKVEMNYEKNQLEIETLFGLNSWLSSMKRVVEEKDLNSKKFNWQIINSLSNSEWYTSDNPVSLINYWDKNNYNFGGAWGIKNTLIIMPISLQKLLYCTIGSKAKIENNESFQNFINKCIIENALLQVYSTGENNFINRVSKRVVDENEFKRIQELFKNWHQFHVDSEQNFWTE